MGGGGRKRMKELKPQEVQFRANRHKFGFTWSCPVGEEHPIISRERIRDVLAERFGHNVHEIAQELHKNGKNHYHAYFKFDQKLDISDCRAFDIDGCHPEIIDPGAGWRGYIKKSDPDLLTNLESCPFAQALAASSVREGMDILALRRPGDYLRYGEAMERNLRRRVETPAPVREYMGPYISDWFPSDWNPYTHSLLLWGVVGLNKTNFAKWLMRHMVGEFEYIKKSHESVKLLSGKKPFIHDEVNCLSDKCEADNSREITDVENGGCVTCRGTNCYIPPGLPRIFISNIAFPFRDPQKSVYGRRLVSLELKSP